MAVTSHHNIFVQTLNALSVESSLFSPKFVKTSVFHVVYTRFRHLVSHSLSTLSLGAHPRARRKRGVDSSQLAIRRRTCRDCVWPCACAVSRGFAPTDHIDIRVFTVARVTFHAMKLAYMRTQPAIGPGL